MTLLWHQSIKASKHQSIKASKHQSIKASCSEHLSSFTNLVTALVFGLVLAGCVPKADTTAELGQLPPASPGCQSCQWRKPSAKDAARIANFQPVAEPFTIAYALSSLQAYNAANPEPGVTWTYGTDDFVAEKTSGETITGSLDQFGFVETLALEFGTTSESLRINYSDVGLVLSVDRFLNGQFIPYTTFSYHAETGELLGYTNHITQEFTDLTESQSLYLEESALELDSRPATSSPLVSIIQALSPCEQCERDYNLAMNYAKNQLHDQMMEASAVLGVCILASLGAGPLVWVALGVCIAAYAIYFAFRVEQYKDALAFNNTAYVNCLEDNNCYEQPEFAHLPRITLPEDPIIDPR